MANRNSSAAAPDAIVAEALERWNRCFEADEEQRKAILLAKKFRAGDQWPQQIRDAREGIATLSQQGTAAQPPRPCLTVDRLSQPVRQISNTIKSASFAIDVVPNGDGADQDTADIFKGYLRRVQNQARGESPIEWAADQAIEGGIGWFRIRTDYVQESADTPGIGLFDQEVRLERITNNLAVYDDPSALKPTRSDSQFRFITEDIFKEEFERRYKDADVAGLEAFRGTGNEATWVTKDMIRIAEYWKITYRDTKFALLTNGQVVSGAKIPKEPMLIKAERTVRQPVVTMYKINAVEVLEKYDWLGSRIPQVPILGEELNVDGRSVLRGVIQEGMDAQRMVNYTYSGAMEIFALAPKSPFIVAAGQVDNYKDIWQTANTYNYAYLPYDPITIGGSVAPPPTLNDREPPIQAAVALMLQSEEAIKATTGIYDSGLGSHDARIQSGRAKQSEIQQSELGSSNYPNNVSRALIYAGELMVEIIPKITRPGQLLHILGVDDEPQQVIVGQAFQEGQGGGAPVPAPGVSPEQAKLSNGLHKFYDLTEGRYAVTVVSGKESATKREEGSAALGELIQHLPPEMAMVATPDYVEQLDFTGSHKIAEKLRKALPPQLQDQSADGQPNPAELQQKLQQQGQLVEQLTAHVNDLSEQIKTKALERQTELDKADKDNATKIRIAEINQQGAFAVADLKASVEAARTAIQEMQELRQAMEASSSRIHDAKDQAREHAHDHILSAQEHAQEMHAAQVQHQQALEQGAQAHQAALEQGQQAADLAPEPQAGAGA